MYYRRTTLGGGGELIESKTIIIMLIVREYLENIRIKNNMNKIIKAIKEIIFVTNRYSTRLYITTQVKGY